MKAVLDTNVLISAFNFPGGAPEDVYRLAIDGRLEIVTSPALLAEFGRILTGKFGWGRDRAEDAITHVAGIAAVIQPRERLEVVAADPADDRVLEAALEAAADIIVSGDKHLLRLRDWRGIRILPPAKLLAEFGPSA